MFRSKFKTEKLDYTRVHMIKFSNIYVNTRSDILTTLSDIADIGDTLSKGKKIKTADILAFYARRELLLSGVVSSNVRK